MLIQIYGLTTVGDAVEVLRCTRCATTRSAIRNARDMWRGQEIGQPQERAVRVCWLDVKDIGSGPGETVLDQRPIKRLFVN